MNRCIVTTKTLDSFLVFMNYEKGKITATLPKYKDINKSLLKKYLISECDFEEKISVLIVSEKVAPWDIMDNNIPWDYGWVSFEDKEDYFTIRTFSIREGIKSNKVFYWDILSAKDKMDIMYYYNFVRNRQNSR